MLDLWAHRRLDDDELARLLGVTSQSVAARREEALDRLAACDELRGIDRADLLGSLRALAPSDWEQAVRGPPPQTDAPPPPPASSGGASADGAPVAAGPSGDRRAASANGASQSGLNGTEAAQLRPSRAGVGEQNGSSSHSGHAPNGGGGATPVSGDTNGGNDETSVRGEGNSPDADDDRPGDLSAEARLAPPAAPRPRPGGPSAAPARRPRRGRAAVLVALLALGAVLAVAIVALAVGPRGPTEPSSDGPSGAEPGSGAAAPGPARELEFLPVTPGVRATGRVALTGRGSARRLRVTLSGLPGGGAEFQLWLYNSLDDAVAVARTKGPNAQFSAPAPADLRSFRYLDVSRAPEGGGRVHSGESLLRVPVAELGASEAAAPAR